MKLGWVQDEPAMKLGRQYTIQNLRDGLPDGVELVDIDLSQPQECDGYIVHSIAVPQNLPVFPKTLIPGQVIKSKPVIMYAHQWDISTFGATMVIYQSPMHASTDTKSKLAIIPPPILDRDFICTEPQERPPNANLWFGLFNSDEGCDIAVRVAEAEKRLFHFFGWNIPRGSETNYCKFNADTVSHTNVGELYASYSKFCYYPRKPQPFKRVVAEALLAGLEVEKSGAIGLFSFEEPLQATLERCRYKAVDEFWELVGSLL